MDWASPRPGEPCRKARHILGASFGDPLPDEGPDLMISMSDGVDRGRRLAATQLARKAVHILHAEVSKKRSQAVHVDAKGAAGKGVTFGRFIVDSLLRGSKD